MTLRIITDGVDFVVQEGQWIDHGVTDDEYIWLDLTNEGWPVTDVDLPAAFSSIIECLEFVRLHFGNRGIHEIGRDHSNSSVEYKGWTWVPCGAAQINKKQEN